MTVTTLPGLDAFEATLARHDSATAALEDWCASRGIADPAVIQAHKLTTHAEPVPEQVRAALRTASGEEVSQRQVRLSCGTVVLSVAWNWYLPARLTPAMNAALKDSDTPFGKVVAPLRFRRETLETIAGAGKLCPAGTISTHRARLVLPDGRPLAYLIECYTAANLALTPP